MADEVTYFYLIANNVKMSDIFNSYLQNSSIASRTEEGVTYFAYFFPNIGWSSQYSQGTPGASVFLTDETNIYVFTSSAAALDAAVAGNYTGGVFTVVRIIRMLRSRLFIPRRGSYDKIGMPNGGFGQAYAEYTDWDGTVKTSAILNQGDRNSSVYVYSKYLNDSTKAKMFAVAGDNSNFVGWTTDLSALPSIPVNNPQLAHAQVVYYAIFLKTSAYVTLSFQRPNPGLTWYTQYLANGVNYPWHTPAGGYYDLTDGIFSSASPRALPPSGDDDVTITPVYDENHGDLIGFDWRFMVGNEPTISRQLDRATPELDPLRVVTFVVKSEAYKDVLRVYARYRIVGTTGLIGVLAASDYVGTGRSIEYASKKTVLCEITGTLAGYAFEKVTRVDGETDVVVSTERNFIIGVLEQNSTLTIHMKENENSVPDVKVSDKYVYSSDNPAEKTGNSFVLSHNPDSPVPEDPDRYYVGYPFTITPDAISGWEAKSVVVKRPGLPDNVIESVVGVDTFSVTHIALDAVYVLVFERLKYDVEAVSLYDTHLGASLSRGALYGKNIIVSHGDTVIFEANLKRRTPANTYFFGGWFRDDIFVSSSTRYSEIITAPTTLRAKLLIKTTVMSFDEDKGTVFVDGLDGQGRRFEDAEITIEATPKEGYTFVGWYNETNKNYSTYTQTWTGVPGVEHTFKANFVLTSLLGTRVFAVRNYNTSMVADPSKGVIDVGDTDAVEITEKEYYERLPADQQDGVVYSEVIPLHGRAGDRFFRYEDSFMGNFTLTANSVSPLFAVNIRRGEIDLEDPDPTFVWSDLDLHTEEPVFTFYSVDYFELFVLWGYAVPLTVSVDYSEHSNSNMGEIFVSNNPIVTEAASSAVVHTGEFAYLTVAPKLGWRFKHWALGFDGSCVIKTPYRVYDSVVIYAVFEMDEHQLFMFDRGQTKMLATWESKVYDTNIPVDMSAVRVDSDNYDEPILLSSKSGESPDLVEDRGQNISISSQDPRRLPKARPVRYHSVSVKFYSKIRRLILSTSMGGLRG